MRSTTVRHVISGKLKREKNPLETASWLAGCCSWNSGGTVPFCSAILHRTRCASSLLPETSSQLGDFGTQLKQIKTHYNGKSQQSIDRVESTLPRRSISYGRVSKLCYVMLLLFRSGRPHHMAESVSCVMLCWYYFGDRGDPVKFTVHVTIHVLAEGVRVGCTSKHWLHPCCNTFINTNRYKVNIK